MQNNNCNDIIKLINNKMKNNPSIANNENLKLKFAGVVTRMVINKTNRIKQ